MNSSRQLLLGTGVFLGGSVLLFAMVKQMDAPKNSSVDDTPKVAEVSVSNAKNDNPLTADVETEERILAQKRIERENKMAELERRTRQVLSEQEKAEALAMQKARLENEQYATNAAEPIIEEKPEDEAPAKTPVTVTKPVVKARPVPVEPVIVAKNNDAKTETKKTAPAKPAETKAETKPAAPQTASNSSQKYTIKRGDNLTKLARQYNVPVQALAQANKMATNSTLRVGQSITVPASGQVDRLVRDYQASNKSSNNTKTETNTKAKSQPASGPSRQTGYEVKAGDGLIKLARQYNVPVSALAEANNMSTNSTLRVGQKLTIPSRAQVARLQREAEQRQAAEQNKRDAQKRLAEARSKAASGEAKGTFGVQVALANNQAKADEIVKQLRAAGYPAKTSKTSRGVRVIVGPEKGKEAALALKDKINADSRTDVNNAWVLYWR
ncbi:SPOR and LysM peptidoglycan-binding domain-containing protein [Psychrobacter sp. FDAARGOS_221]|uniref:SPOR and LysM peptidoglycan-binding domain-containing protein n=1 Tax=Psychrobacter sp. FDAARGOS_221 TaxID=1975705 RepID=UPI000BB57BBB|nr:LysM peptidoglycan-binding domain-containing protein [Psychrobacter sp. FDAARGOS_221]PNK61321.1 LysM peptidoglycan-binding domain-containing protein [Psychrobacter sp. FDAARGOS_221]